VQDQKLIEKHGKAQGVDIQVEWNQLSGGTAMNDALLSGNIDRRRRRRRAARC
jgi:NitT/TauT family transport system substrate-binding protein